MGERSNNLCQGLGFWGSPRRWQTSQDSEAYPLPGRHQEEREGVLKQAV